MKTRTYLILPFCFVVNFFLFTSLLKAQQVVTGRITDAIDGTPIQYAYIVIANTSSLTTSDESGNYSITVPGNGSFEIVVSHVGYQSAFHKIDTPQSFHQYDVALEANELQEIIVSASANYRRRDVDLFWNRILGERPSRNGMEVLNPEKVYYYLNSDNVLKVSCKEPIEIINHHTGYHIWYILESFQHDYRSNETTFYGAPYFEEIIPQNSRQRNNWEKKRQEAYAVSITHFIQALYREQILEDGFLLVNKDSLLLKEKPSPIFLKDILQTTYQDMILVNIKEPLFLVCFSKPVTDEMIQSRYSVLWKDVNTNHPITSV